MKATLMENGCTFVSEGGKQIAELQESWFQLYLEFLVKHGIDPTTVEFELPGGRRAYVFETENGYNWQFQPLPSIQEINSNARG